MLLYPVRPATRLAGSSIFCSVYTKSLYVTGIFLPPQYQFAFGLIVYDSDVFVADAADTRSLTYTPLLFCRNAPCWASTAPMKPPISWLQQARLGLNPLMSCSTPKTRTDLALRPAVVRGSFAHAWANGAAEDSAPLAEPATLVVAVADAATNKMAAAAPARSQRRLCIDSLRLSAPGAFSGGGACSLLRPQGASRSVCKTTARQLS